MGDESSAFQPPIKQTITTDPLLSTHFHRHGEEPIVLLPFEVTPYFYHMNGIKVFENAELFELILYRTNGRVLARCARVCKLWSETALDILWSKQQLGVATFLKILHPQVCIV